MSLIKILSDQTINQIAAGEVIESPASVIKELVENSLDAGATRVFVEIKEGGFQLIRVIDNGCGMEPHDALLSLERHATSKISEVHDLSSLTTMGFRGEALASIAAISKLTLTTAVKDAPGTKIESEGGKVLSLTPFPRKQGTTLEVRSLFYNVPARKKFQKSSQASTTEIHRLLITLALAYPDVIFEFVSQEKEVFSFIKDSDLKLRIREIFGDDFVKQAKRIDKQVGDYHIKGFLGSAQHSRLNRTGQYTFINRRAVIAPAISFAVKDGYGTRLSSDRYPIYVLHLKIPPSFVDVNVHPQKREVRFQQESSLKQMIKEQVGKALESFPAHHVEAGTPCDSSKEKQDLCQASYFPWDRRKEDEPLNLQNDENRFSNSHQKDMQVSRLVFRETAFPPSESLFPLKPELQLIGLFCPYLLLQSEGLEAFLGKKIQEEGSVVWIDLLAAEERTTFDLLKEKEGRPLSQGLLIPVCVELARDEAVEIERKLPEIEKLGFSIRSIGKHVFAVEAIPPFLSAAEVCDVLHILAEDKEEPCRLIAKFTRRRKKTFMLQEALALAEKILQLPSPQLTPAGAPIIALMSQHEIKKLFQ